MEELGDGAPVVVGMLDGATVVEGVVLVGSCVVVLDVEDGSVEGIVVVDDGAGELVVVPDGAIDVVVAGAIVGATVVETFVGLGMAVVLGGAVLEEGAAVVTTVLL